MRLVLPLAALAILAGASRASAQEVVVLRAEGDVTAEERDAIAAALREELALDVREGAEAGEGEIGLRVAISSRRARLEVTRPLRERLVRTATLPRNPDARLHTLVTLAVNVTRDEAAELLSSLRRSQPEADAPPEEAAGVEPTTGETLEEEAPASSAPEPEPAVAIEPASSEQAVAPAPADPAPADPAPADPAPADPAPADPVGEAEPAADAAAVDPWRHRPLRIGASAHLGTAPEPGSGIAPWTLYGLDVLVAPIPEVAVGIRELGAFGGQRVVFTVNPVVEGALRVLPELALHATLGSDLQIALDEGNGSLAVAPRLGLGARFYPDPTFSIAIDLTGRVVATDVFRTLGATMPAGAILLTAGLSFAFHVE